MCEYLTPPASNDFSELPATESARSFSRTVVATRCGLNGILNGDRPIAFQVKGAPADRASTEAVNGAASRADQSRHTLMLFEFRDDAIDGVALGDASEIELDAGLVEADRPRARIEGYMSAPDQPPRCRQLGVGWHAAFAAEEAPRLHQRSDGDVERAIRIPAVSHGVDDEVEELLFDCNGMAGSLAVHEGQGAVRFVMTHQPVDPVDFVECVLHDTRQVLAIGAVRLDGVHAAHGHPMCFVTVEKLGLVECRMDRRGTQT